MIGPGEAPTQRGAAIAGALLAVLVALSLAGDVYRIPVQVSDSLDLIERAHELPSVGAAFMDGLTSSSRKFRPLRTMQTKLLLEMAVRAGGRYHLVFRGFHVLLVVLLVALFWHLVGGGTWADVAALALGFAVLTGMHTFTGLLREAFPINMFLLVIVCGLSLLALARTRGGWAVDTIAAAVFAIGVLTLESGLLIGVVAVAAYVGGLRGVSRRGLAAIIILGVIYLVVRIGFLDITASIVRLEGTGYLTRWLSGDEQIRQFGQPPVGLYLYTSAMSLLSVVLSQPEAGRWTVAVAYLNGTVPPVFWLEMGTSLAATLLLVWYAVSKQDDGLRRWRDPVVLVFLVTLIANAVLSATYAKDEIISFAGTFFALAVATAASHALRRACFLGPAAAVALACVLAVASCGWTMRAAGLHFKLRHGAFDARSEWAAVLSPRDAGQVRDPQRLELVTRLREEAMLRRTVAPSQLPRWAERWWGED